MNGSLTIVIAIAGQALMAGITIGILKADTKNIKDNLRDLKDSFQKKCDVVDEHSVSIAEIKTKCEETHKWSGRDRREHG
jgi:hypothetical protein